jgi:hypothetical protein
LLMFDMAGIAGWVYRRSRKGNLQRIDANQD